MNLIEVFTNDPSELKIFVQLQELKDRDREKYKTKIGCIIVGGERDEKVYSNYWNGSEWILLSNEQINPYFYNDVDEWVKDTLEFRKKHKNFFAKECIWYDDDVANELKLM